MARRLGARYNYEYNVTFIREDKSFGAATLTSSNELKRPEALRSIESFIADSYNCGNIIITSYMLVSRIRR